MGKHKNESVTQIGIQSRTDKMKIYSCEDCPFSTKYRADIRRHKERHKVVLFPCEECNMPFMTLGHLNGHLEKAHEIKQASDKRVWMKCEKCVYVTRHSSDMSRHMTRHKQAVATCRSCGRPFNVVKKLLEHIKHEHGNSDKESECRKRKELKRKCKSISEQSVSQNAELQDYDDDYDYEDCSELPKKLTKTLKQNNDIEKIVKIRHKTQIPSVQETDEIQDFATEQSVESYTISDVVQQNEPNTVTIGSDDSASRPMRCTFCGFVTYSFQELRDHLDVHDSVDLFTDVPFRTPVYPDSCIRDRTSYRSASDISIFHREVNNLSFAGRLPVEDDLCVPPTSNVSVPATSNVTVPQTVTVVNSGSDILSFVRGIIVGREGHTYLCNQSKQTTKETDTSLINFVTIDNHQNQEMIADSIGKLRENTRVSMPIPPKTKLPAENNTTTDGTATSSEFLEKPFACSKCFYATKNLEHLQVHVEAHLYEIAISSDSDDKQNALPIFYSPKNNEDIRSTKAQTVKVLVNHESSINNQCDMNVTNKETMVRKLQSSNAESDGNSRDNDAINFNDSNKDMQIKGKHVKPTANTQNDTPETVHVNSRNENTTYSTIGRLSKEQFKKNRRFFARCSDCANGSFRYECLICENYNQFESRQLLREHFEDKHRNIRKRICKSCNYCSNPFP